MDREPRLNVLVAGAIRHAAEYAARVATHPRLALVAVAEDACAPAWQRARAEALAAAHGVRCESLDAALDDPALDLVLVTTEPARHAETATRAIEAGHAVLVDKPVATSGSDARRLAAVALRAAGVTGYVHRLFSPAVEQLRDHMATGALGSPRQLALAWISANDVDQEGGEVVLAPALSGGGELWNFLGYPLDTVLWLTGSAVRRVSAATTSRTSAAHRGHGVESLAVVTLELDAGVHASITVGRGPAIGAGVYTTSIAGSRGYVAIDELRPALDFASCDRCTTVLGDDELFELTFDRLLDDVVAAIDGRGTLRRTLADGCELARVIASAYEAAASGEASAPR